MSAPLATVLAPADQEVLRARIRTLRGFDLACPPGGAVAFLAWALLDLMPGAWIWVADGPNSLESLYQDLRGLQPDRADNVLLFPAWERLPGADRPPDPEIAGQRLNTLARLAAPAGPLIVVASIQALMQPVPAPARLAATDNLLVQGATCDLESLCAALAAAGYQFVPEVVEKGQAARRGGIVDVWPCTEEWPVRLEFFGDTLDSLRAFDPLRQTSNARLERLRLTPPGTAPAGGGPDAAAWSDFSAYVPEAACVAWLDPGQVREHAALYAATWPKGGAGPGAQVYAEVRAALDRRPLALAMNVYCQEIAEPATMELALEPCDALPQLDGLAGRVDLMEETRRRYVQELARQAAAGDRVHLFFDTAGARDRFFQAYEKDCPAGGVNCHVGGISCGLIYPPGRLRIVAESDLYGFRKQRRPASRAKARGVDAQDLAPLTGWGDLQPGDLVVHASHGIGKYLGLYEMEFNGQKQEVLAIEYAEGARLFVPAAQVHLLSRYVGLGRIRPDLHELGGGRWQRQKAAAEKAVQDLAAKLLETQAARDTLGGHAFAADTHWQHEFEAAFPYEETTDQLAAIAAVKTDMEQARPMDRLICGDVGYGKTEVAMRAAFKAVMDGRQVAVLVPTTVLAQQHLYTFRERMSAFPVRVEMLSRFRTPAEQQAVVHELKAGSVDVVIGTHRLVQPDVAFKNLGLVIIDEEQRFGVAHKERLKELRQLVDVLTLTATPIPRTLYLSLTGARDLSTIQTAPRERLPIETIVAEFKEDTIRQAILFELSREGQVFFLHNRVKTIHAMEEKIKQLVPEARIAVAHGQMGERELADVMTQFVRGQSDVLLCTTIIESGVDIPNVNTIIIDRADRFGLADLYQLRGRVGRYKHKAYAYLLLPRHGRLFDTARQRIQAIRRHSSLGAGFKLALRDLEIRGAGNLLGAAQSGHIAAIGFDLYCQLLRRTVAQKKGEEVPPLIQVEMHLDFIDLSPRPPCHEGSACLPYDFMEDENLRLAAYRRLAGLINEAEVDALEREFRDRYGSLPAPVLRLLDLARVRLAAAARGVTKVETADGKLVLTRDRDYIMIGHRFPRLKSRTAAERLREILRFIKSC